MHSQTRSLTYLWDIIRQYADISVDNLESSLDSPENGILLDIEMHRAFDQFKWCFVPTVSQIFHAFVRLKLTVAFAGATRRIQGEVVWRETRHL